jgi:endonuclease-3
MAAKRKTAVKSRTKSKTKTKRKSGSKTAARRKAAPAKSRARSKSNSAARKRALSILDGLEKQHPDAHCELDFSNGLELLVATILAAQCTDKRVNMVTKELFKKYTRAQDYIDTPSEVLEEEIRTTGFFRNKTKSIKKACVSLVERFGGGVPDNMDDLLELAGVGRKTANVILANVFGVPGVVVDTHMLRISRRMGFTENTDATKVEFDLMEIFPQDTWISLSHQIPWHGRRVCSARKPMCEECGAAHACPKLI